MDPREWRSPEVGAAHEDVPPVTRFYEWECDRFLRDQRRDILWYRRLVAETGGPVLELACGAGRVALDLAADGHDVVGLDLQPYLLERARAHAAERGLHGRLTLVQGDMRDFALGRRFPLVLLPYNTLGYLLTEGEVAGCFRAIAAHLEAGGVFALQVSPFERGETPGPRTPLTTGPFEDGHVAMYEAISADPERHLTHYDEEYHLLRPGRPVEIHRQRLTLRSYYRGEITRLLGAAGLSVRAVHGDFDGRPYPLRGHPAGPMLFEAVRSGLR